MILQAILPFLLFAGGDDAKPIELQIQGGTNVDFSLSYEYLDQVLLPRLESSFEGVSVERKLVHRGWSKGPQSRGSIVLTIYPLRPGQPLRQLSPIENPYDGTPSERRKIVHSIDVTMIVPSYQQAILQKILTEEIAGAFPHAELAYKHVEDSGNDKQMYTLLVAKDASGMLRWGCDESASPKQSRRRQQGHELEDFAWTTSRAVVCGLSDELLIPGSTVDKFLQDQLIIFQALAEGTTSFPRAAAPKSGSDDDVEVASQDMAQLNLGERMKKDKTDKPFGYGSLHAQTARWVASEILPAVEWYNKGTICKGVGTSFS